MRVPILKRKDILKINKSLKNSSKPASLLATAFILKIKTQTQSQVQETLPQKSRTLKILIVRRKQTLNDSRT